jgi:hypothetical protein
VPTSNLRGGFFAGSLIRESALILLVFLVEWFLRPGPDSGHCEICRRHIYMTADVGRFATLYNSAERAAEATAVEAPERAGSFQMIVPLVL